MDLSSKNENSRLRSAGPLEYALRRSVTAILAERLLRLGAALVTLALFFVALSWLGFWRAVPVEARMLGVSLFGFLALYLASREIARGLPKRRAAAARLDAAADGPLKPAASLDDTLAAQNADPATAALWALHRKRLETALAQTPVAAPRPRLPERDPYALRALALVAAVAAAFVAGDEKRARLAAAFDWRAIHLLEPAQRIDAWFDPPAYMGRPPIVLGQESGAVQAPVNSTLRLRPTDANVSVEGALTPIDSAEKKERGFALGGDARIDLSDGRSFTIAAIPDLVPTIELVGKPRNNARGTMTLSYRAEDDYGVVSAEAVFSKQAAGRALYEPPRLPLELPAGAGGLGEGRATLDLADSPYAGARMTMRLIAKDAAGNEGASDPTEVTLPQRRFTKPLAKALVEQRRILALDPDQRANVRAALEALSIAPEVFDTPSAVHLGLRAARRSLEGKPDDDALRGVADMLWAMALSLEDGNAPQAERDLRAAEQALREALARGANDEEIAKRTQDLRAALDKFLEQLGARAQPPDQQQSESASDPDSVTPSDLQAMLDDIEKAMKSGDMAEAQRLLDELQDIMENAQTGDASGAQNAAREKKRREMQRALSEIDQLAREEQQLRDDTFQGMKNPTDDDARRPQQRGGKKGQAQAGDDAGPERQRQQGLRDKLERQQDAMKGEAGEAGEALDDARKSMKEAEEALKPGGEGRGKAVDAQGRAVESLRKGADKLAEQMRGDGQQGEEGEEGQSGKGHGKARGRFGQGRDPLGRSSGGQRASHEKYDPLGLPPAQRAHRVQEELRRRLGQPERPTEELDYLQRLLRR
ncbi:TIGR02302 family protein [Methylocystis iwaonis]|uniref:TIGR02302 family protein n=1 Tax=Methylocystis iwaonis TaxID=2885079 RepID=UPI002E7AF64C|nr:TIGR02302 family protein [Methylocystis iwaonis]